MGGEEELVPSNLLMMWLQDEFCVQVLCILSAQIHPNALKLETQATQGFLRQRSRM